ncbi:MAG: methyltransferase domain-containing protein [Kofleriaceae bacterium]
MLPGADRDPRPDLSYQVADASAARRGPTCRLRQPDRWPVTVRGETVLDLGAGGGFDCFLAARQVGPTGRVIGVDMTPDMVTLARANATKAGTANVEFRLGEIEHLPVADGSVDVILSNCVVNLAPDKAEVYREAFRVLRADGRLALSDVVTIAPIPPALRAQAAALTGCVAGAASIDDHRAALVAAGFVDVEVTVAAGSAAIVNAWLPGADRFVATATIAARRPGAIATGARPAAAAPTTPPAPACCAPTCCT